MSVITLHRTRPARVAPARSGVSPWLAALTGFVTGFLVAMLPAAFVTRVFATQLPLGGSVVHGRTALVISLVLTTCVALSTAVCAAAKAVHGRG